MILFKHIHIFPILIGLKTQTRRTWEKARVKPGSIHLAKTEMISKQFFARLKVIAVYQERLGDMTEQDAWEEGGLRWMDTEKPSRESMDSGMIIG